MKKISVFCGSNPGRKKDYCEAAFSLGYLLAKRNIGLVYGGGRVGVMGKIADAVLRHGGHVTGVIPKMFIEKRYEHKGVNDLIVVDSMHQRKQTMVNLSDAFIALPGGIGTLEEFFEIFTWAQLGLHQKPFGLLNSGRFFDKLLGFLDHIVEQSFLMSPHRNMIQVADTPHQLLDRLQNYEATYIEKVIKPPVDG